MPGPPTSISARTSASTLSEAHLRVCLSPGGHRSISEEPLGPPLSPKALGGPLKFRWSTLAWLPDLSAADALTCMPAQRLPAVHNSILGVLTDSALCRASLEDGGDTGKALFDARGSAVVSGTQDIDPYANLAIPQLPRIAIKPEVSSPLQPGPDYPPLSSQVPCTLPSCAGRKLALRMPVLRAPFCRVKPMCATQFFTGRAHGALV